MSEFNKTLIIMGFIVLAVLFVGLFFIAASIGVNTDIIIAIFTAAATGIAILQYLNYRIEHKLSTDPDIVLFRKKVETAWQSSLTKVQDGIYVGVCKEDDKGNKTTYVQHNIRVEFIVVNPGRIPAVISQVRYLFDFGTRNLRGPNLREGRFFQWEEEEKNSLSIDNLPWTLPEGSHCILRQQISIVDYDHIWEESSQDRTLPPPPPLKEVEITYYAGSKQKIYKFKEDLDYNRPITLAV